MLAFSDASEETVVVLLGVLWVALVEVLLDDAVELPVALDDEAVEELDEFEELDEPAVGSKVWCPGPKPTSDAKVPPTVTASLSFLPVMTRLPWLLSDAVT